MAVWVQIALLALTPVFASAGGAIEGVVELGPPRPAPVSKPRYPVSAAYTVGAPDPPAAVVFVEAAVPEEPAPRPAEMAQRDYQFAPGLLPVLRGTVVRFPNRDDEYHSVFSYSKPNRFDLGRYHRDEVPAEVAFDEPGVVKIFCEIHDHMRGTVLVLETPYFTKTDEHGRYRLEGLPEGRQVVKVWIDEDTLWERTVDVRDGEVVAVNFPARSGADPS